MNNFLVASIILGILNTCVAILDSNAGITDMLCFFLCLWNTSNIHLLISFALTMFLKMIFLSNGTFFSIVVYLLAFIVNYFTAKTILFFFKKGKVDNTFVWKLFYIHLWKNIAIVLIVTGIIFINYIMNILYGNEIFTHSNEVFTFSIEHIIYNFLNLELNKWQGYFPLLLYNISIINFINTIPIIYVLWFYQFIQPQLSLMFFLKRPDKKLTYLWLFSGLLMGICLFSDTVILMILSAIFFICMCLPYLFLGFLIFIKTRLQLFRTALVLPFIFSKLMPREVSESIIVIFGFIYIILGLIFTIIPEIFQSDVDD